MLSNLEFLRFKVTGWANQMASRFGHPVYLVGSSLHQEHPRDTDIRVMLPDDEFEARYGNVLEWIDDTWHHEWRDARQKWAKDVGKLSRDAVLSLRVNIDFQVYPESYGQNFVNKTRMRIDTLMDFPQE